MNQKKIYIGSAQFGSNYGITNNNFLNVDEIKKISTFATNNNIINVDTSPMYGNSEEIIGELFNSFKITTKVPKYQFQNIGYSKWIEKSFFKSLEVMQIKNLDTLLFHDMEDFNNYYCKDCHELILNLVKQGKLKRIGFSIYDEDQLSMALKKLDPDVVQVPYNIFDRRIEESSILSHIRSKGTKIVARSVFLQGLLISKDFSFQKLFGHKEAIFREWFRLCSDQNIDPIHACLDFVKKSNFIDGFIIGISSLKEISQAMQVYHDTSEINISINRVDDVSIVDPRKWGN